MSQTTLSPLPAQTSFDWDEGSNTSATAVPQRRQSHLSLKPGEWTGESTPAPTTRTPQFNHESREYPKGESAAAEETPAGNGAQEELQLEESTSQRPFKNVWHELLFMVLVTSAQLITQANLGNTVIPGEAVAKGLGATGTSSQTWFVASYSCTVGAFVLVTGRLGDLYGRKNLFCLGWLWIVAFNLGLGFVRSQIPFDILRALAGIGPSMLMPNAAALLATAWPDPKSSRDRKMKALAFTIFGAIAPGGYVIGAAWGSAITQLGASWRWIYWSVAIVAAAQAVAVFLVVPGSGAFNARGMGGFDFIGSFLGLTGLVLVFVSLNGGPSFGWNTAWVPVLLVLGLLSIAAFVHFENRTQYPILPMSIFRSPTFFAVAVSLCLGWMSFGMFQYYTPHFLMTYRAQTPLGAVLQMLPVALTGIVAAVAAVMLLPRVPGYVIFGAAMLCFFVGQLLLALTPVDQSYWRMTFPTTLVITFGPDLSFACASLIASDSIAPEQQGVAGSFINTVVNYSIAMGLALAGNVEVNVNRGGQDPLRGYRGAWWCGAGFAALGGIMTAVFHKGMSKRHKAD